MVKGKNFLCMEIILDVFRLTQNNSFLFNSSLELNLPDLEFVSFEVCNLHLFKLPLFHDFFCTDSFTNK